MRYSCFLPCFFSLTQALGPIAAFAESPVYYIDDGAGLRPVYTGNPSDRQADEWHVRLYRTGMPTGGSDNWGLISRKSADECMSHLMACQATELASARSMGYSESRDILTYFNFLGPIAKVRSSKSYGKQLLESAGIVKRMHSAWKQAKSLQSTESKGTNPYANVGKVVGDYLKSLTKAQGKLSELEKKLATTNMTEEEINTALAEMGRDLDNADSAYKSLQTLTSPGKSGSGSNSNQEATVIPALPTGLPRLGDKDYLHLTGLDKAGNLLGGCGYPDHTFMEYKSAFRDPPIKSFYNCCYGADGTLHIWAKMERVSGYKGTYGYTEGVKFGEHGRVFMYSIKGGMPDWVELDSKQTSPSDPQGRTQSVDDSPTTESSIRQDTGAVQTSNSLEQIKTEVAAIIRQHGTFLKEEQNQRTQYDTKISWPSPGRMQIVVSQVGSFKFSSGWRSGGGNIKTVDLSLRDVQRVDLDTLAGFNLDYVSLLAREGKAFKLIDTSLGTDGEPEADSSAESDDFHCMIPVASVEVGQSLAQAIRSAVEAGGGKNTGASTSTPGDHSMSSLSAAARPQSVDESQQRPTVASADTPKVPMLTSSQARDSLLRSLQACAREIRVFAKPPSSTGELIPAKISVSATENSSTGIDFYTQVTLVYSNGLKEQWHAWVSLRSADVDLSSTLASLRPENAGSTVAIVTKGPVRIKTKSYYPGAANVFNYETFNEIELGLGVESTSAKAQELLDALSAWTGTSN